MAHTPARRSAGGLVVGRYALFVEIASRVAWPRCTSGDCSVRLDFRASWPSNVCTRSSPRRPSSSRCSSTRCDWPRRAAPNVVATLDIVEDGGELFLVMEYVHGESLAQLIRTTRAHGVHVPPAIAASIGVAFCTAFTRRTKQRREGEPWDHPPRCFSAETCSSAPTASPGCSISESHAPRAGLQNTAKSVERQRPRTSHPSAFTGTRRPKNGRLRRGVVLWEMLTGATLFDAENDAAVLAQIVGGASAAAEQPRSHVPSALEDITLAACPAIQRSALPRRGRWLSHFSSGSASLRRARLEIGWRASPPISFRSGGRYSRSSTAW